MGTDPPDQLPASAILRTAEELFARPECTHLISLNNPGQNMHLERTSEGFRLTTVSPDADRHSVRVFHSLDDVRSALAPMVHFLPGAIWRDAAEYPPFPQNALYRLLVGPVELSITPNDEHSTVHGPHIVYGPVVISTLRPNHIRVTPTANWLVIEYPASTSRGSSSGYAILRPTRTFLQRLRLRFDNYRARHAKRSWMRYQPSSLLVCGVPPTDWQSTRHVLTATQPASTA